MAGENRRGRNKRMGSIRRWFSQRGRTQKQEMKRGTLESPEVFNSRLPALLGEFTDRLEGVLANNRKLDNHLDNMKECVSDIRDQKEIIKDLKEQLNDREKEERRLNGEIKCLYRQNNDVEIKSCRFEVENKHLNQEKGQLSKQLENAQDSMKTLSQRLAESQKDRERLEDERCDLERRNWDLDLKLKEAENGRDKLLDTNRLQDNIICRMREDRRSLLDFVHRRSLAEEQKLRSAWAHVNEARKQKNVAMTFHRANKPLMLEESTGFEHMKTKVLELDHKLFRRDKLLELLTERLRIHEPRFDIRNDPALSVYLDDEIIAEDVHLLEDTFGK